MNRTKKYFKRIKYPPVTIANCYGRYIYLNYSNDKPVAENIDPGDIKFRFAPVDEFDKTEWVLNVSKRI